MNPALIGNDPLVSTSGSGSGASELPFVLSVLDPKAAAEYLRVSESTVIAEAENGRLPGRKIGPDWRFLEVALADWLRTGQLPMPEAKPVSSKERMLALAGMWKDDPTVDPMIEEIYRKRKAGPEVLTLTQAAEYLQLPEDAVRAEAEIGSLIGQNVRGEWRFARDSILAWLRTPRIQALQPRTTSAGSPETPEEQEAFFASIRAYRDEIDRATGHGKYAPE
ncbi:MAG: hypothetical protein JWO38_3718 [Gemmataceae bacterium]|nr:hypothetical protein [Gemmataceae bacterium]